MTWLHYPGHFAALVLVTGVAGLFLFAFWTEQWTSSGKKRWLLPPLQILPALLVLLLLWDPSHARIKERDVPNTVLAVFDTSESMSIADVDGAKRLDKAIESFERVFRPGAPDAPQFAVYGFDSIVHEGDAPRALPRWGSRTNLAPVAELLQKSALTGNANAQRHIVGAVIFTDGQAAEKAPEALPAVANKDFRVEIVGVGADDSPGDVAVTRIDAPARALLDTGIPLRVTLAGSLPAGMAARLEVVSGGVPVAMQDVDGALLANGTTIDVTVPARPLGPLAIEARVSAKAPESNTANNVRQAVVNVVEEPRLKVLFYSQWANFDIGKMRQVLSREKKVSLDFALDALIKGPRQGTVPPPPNADARKLPDTREAMNAYDIIVLGPVDVRELTTAQVDALYAFVAERGGGLLILPGEDQLDLALSRDAKIRTLLPTVAKAGTWETNTVERPILVSEEGRAMGLPATDDLPKPPANLTPYYQVEAKPASTVAAQYDDTPALVFQRVGRGHVALLNLRRLFVLYRDEDGGALRVLVSAIVTHLGAAVRDAAQTQVYAERVPDDPQSVVFTANVFDSQFRPSAGATVLLTVGDQAVRMAESTPGSYRAAIRTRGEETLIAQVEAVKEGVLIGKATTTARLPLPHGEMDKVERDRAYLKAAADKLGASYCDLDQLTSQANSFPATSRVEEIADVSSAWRTWTVLCVVCSLLTGAWFTRRFMGLV
ncbi:MAG: VWA domain-containing protein [Candidatus Hydrogenedentes bacterium]|nr:VWA domain-containing protein [Candidatus Hydrogenedentota bacterium]